MAELEVAGGEVAANRDALVAALEKMEARRLVQRAGVAGTVEAVVERYRLPDEREVELWADNYTPLSLRGEPGLLRELASAAGVELVDG